MTVVDYVVPFLKDFKSETKKPGGHLLSLRYAGDKLIKLKPGKTKILSTGVFLKTSIDAEQLTLNETNPSWDQDINFQLVPYIKDKPLKVQLVNNSEEGIYIFPKNLLSVLLVKQ